MALGKGLDALIPKRSHSPVPETSPVQIGTAGRILEISPDEIQVNPHQPRKVFHHADLENLIESIKVHGILQPLVVSTRPDGGFELIAGERRLRASKVAGLEKVPVIVREAKEQEKLELALIENIQRKNLNPLEEAIAYQRLIEEFDLNQEELARRVGKSRSTVANTLRLNSLPEEIQQAIMDERISEGHARAIASLESVSAQMQLMKKIIDNTLSVRETERQAGGLKKFKTKSFDPALMEFEEKLRQRLGTMVIIKKRGQKGAVEIPFKSHEDLNNLMDKLLS